MAENFVRIILGSESERALQEARNLAEGDGLLGDYAEMSGSINGQPIDVRFYADEDEDAPEPPLIEQPHTRVGWNGRTWAVITMKDGEIRDTEFLDVPPQWDGSELPVGNVQYVREGNINGGDSIPVRTIVGTLVPRMKQGD